MREIPFSGVETSNVLSVLSKLTKNGGARPFFRRTESLAHRSGSLAATQELPSPAAGVMNTSSFGSASECQKFCICY
jgi:hypothetical protein